MTPTRATEQQRTIPGGFLLTFEGIGGSGKSTLSAGLATHLEASGWRVERTREPGGTPLGRSLRTLLLEAPGPTDPWAEAFLFNADRAQTYSEVIEPSLAAGKVVMSDRGPFGTVAYQGYGRGLDLSLIDHMSEAAWRGRKADLVFVVDVDPRVGLERKGRDVERDRFDREDLEFQSRAREGYLFAARRRGSDAVVIDGSLDQDAALAQVLAVTLERLHGYELATKEEER